MKNIGLLPLDSRPCNTSWLQEFSKIVNVNLIMFDRNKCGTLFKGANIDEEVEWLKENYSNLDYLIVSTDGLSFGGLVQARKAQINLEEVLNKLNILREIKDKNPSLKIYCFDTIMRNAITALDDESAKYYNDLLEFAVLKGKTYFFKDNIEYSNRLKELEKKIPERVIAQYLNARNTKRRINEFFIDLYNDGYLSKYMLLQEDATPYGIQAIDQEILNEKMRKLGLIDKIPLFNGTDEGASVMLASILVDMFKADIKVCVDTNDNIVLDKCHLFEDRAFKINLDNMFKIIGLESVPYDKADCVLSIYGEERNDYLDLNHYYIVELNKNESFKKYIANLNKMISEKPVFFADLFFPNGGSFELLNEFNYKGLKGYSAWNTSSNTMGTLLCQLVCYMISKNESLNNEFSEKRFVDDCIFQYIARRKATEELINKNYSELNLKDGNDLAYELVNKIMSEYKDYASFDFDTVLPWGRMFECEIIKK